VGLSGWSEDNAGLSELTREAEKKWPCKVTRDWILAANQLETAIGLFVGGHDKSSVITLAGAADGILSQLVKNKGEENFTETLLKRDDDKTLTRGTMGKHVNDILCINALKHMDEGDDGYIVFDLEQCAVGAILKAIANYVKLCGHDVGFVQAFLAWVKLNLDPRIYNVDCDPDWKPSAPTAEPPTVELRD
jgi:hypothetical protein